MSAAARRASAPRPWTHYVNDRFFDRTDLEPNLERLAFRLERLARDRAWCVTSNDELRRLLGCSRNTLAATLNRGESLGWFRRVLVPGRHGRATARLGFVLFVRPTDRPTATPETFDRVADELRAELRRGPAQTLPFPATGPQNLGTTVPRTWAPPVPRTWAPLPCSKEETLKETTTTAVAGSSSSLDHGSEPDRDEPPGIAIPGETTAPHGLAVTEPRPTIVLSPAPAEAPPAAPSTAPALPAELAAAAATAIPGASREWLESLLRDCGDYGPDLALLVLEWVKRQAPKAPTRYARVALSGWLMKLEARVLTLEDVRSEVRGRSGPLPAAGRPFDPKVCLARLASLGWAIVPHGGDQVIPREIPGRGAPLWRNLPEDLRRQVELHRAELKAHVLNRASERGKAVALRA